ncbi:hypothetical protein DFH08DRAFT_423166 [Mycena albidolilacea]|uniref:Uncharacterized protein n=1 Tax=Mycena albidolilacea TaxID=1033008 RepID=A0AAD7EEU8_9AGAR|nr:hypothetical protein DFH08DRAFT_423166 [Mycena albidolilacea]
MQPETPSNSESPRSSNTSGRSTPPLFSGSSTLSSSSRSSASSSRWHHSVPESSPLTQRTQRLVQSSHPYIRTKRPESIRSRLPSNPDLDDDPLYVHSHFCPPRSETDASCARTRTRTYPTAPHRRPRLISSPTRARRPLRVCSPFTPNKPTPAFPPSLARNQRFLQSSPHLHLLNRASSTTASPAPSLLPRSLTATTSPAGTYTLTSGPAPFRRPRPVQRAGQTTASQLLAAVEAEAQSVATGIPPLQEGLPTATTGMSATATTGTSATATTGVSATATTARTTTPPQRRTTMAVSVPITTKRGVSPGSTREVQTKPAATAI